jgi:hypothetical protein
MRCVRELSENMIRDISLSIITIQSLKVESKTTGNDFQKIQYFSIHFYQYQALLSRSKNICDNEQFLITVYNSLTVNI